MPTAHETAQAPREVDHGAQLANQVDMWQTPATDSFRSRGGTRKDEMGLDQQARSHQVQPIHDGHKYSATGQNSPRRLNPQFVEWLMGFPIGWSKP